MTGPQDPHSPQEPWDPNPPPGGYGPPSPQPPSQQPQQPGYGQYGYPPQQPPPGQYAYPGQQQPVPAGPRPSLSQRIGDRAVRRPVPRFGVTIVGVGIALVVLGIVVWGFTYLAEGIASSVTSGGSASSSDSRRFLGFALALVVVVAGYALVVVSRDGPRATAGIAATALGVPVAMEFATLDLTGGSPVNNDAVVWVSVIVYLLSYLFVRGARGHTIYLGLSLLLLWEYAIDKVLPSTAAIGSSVVGSAFGSSEPVPTIDTGTLATVSLVFAVVYYVIAYGLDRSGRHGAALPFAVVGIPAMLVGIIALSPDAKRAGTGIVLLLVGVVLALYGAAFGRRFTAWFWGLAAGVGAVLVLSQFVTKGAGIGIGMIVLGVVFVAGGVAAAVALREPADMALDQRGVPTG